MEHCSLNEYYHQVLPCQHYFTWEPLQVTQLTQIFHQITTRCMADFRNVSSKRHFKFCSQNAEMLNIFNSNKVTVAFSSCVCRWQDAWKFLEQWHLSQAVETRLCHWGSTKPALTLGAVGKSSSVTAHLTLHGHVASLPARASATAKYLRKHFKNCFEKHHVKG